MDYTGNLLPRYRRVRDDDDGVKVFKADDQEADGTPVEETSNHQSYPEVESLKNLSYLSYHDSTGAIVYTPYAPWQPIQMQQISVYQTVTPSIYNSWPPIQQIPVHQSISYPVYMHNSIALQAQQFPAYQNSGNVTYLASNQNGQPIQQIPKTSKKSQSTQSHPPNKQPKEPKKRRYSPAQRERRQAISKRKMENKAKLKSAITQIKSEKQLDVRQIPSEQTTSPCIQNPIAELSDSQHTAPSPKQWFFGGRELEAQKQPEIKEEL